MSLKVQLYKQSGGLPFKDLYAGLIGKGMRPEMALLTVARKIAAIALKIWKTGEPFDARKLSIQRTN